LVLSYGSKLREAVKMEKTVILKNCRSGLGMKICGGQNDDGTYTGIFVKRILLGGAVASDGTLQEGDELLSANGESLQKCNNDRAVAILRHASQSGMVCITYQRDEASRARLEKLFPSKNDSLFGSMRQYSGENHETGNILSRSDSVSSRISITSLEKRAWIYNGDHMSPTPLREPKVHIELSEKGELKRMEAMDLPLSPRDMERWSIDIHGDRVKKTGIRKIREGTTELERVSSFDSGFPSSGRHPSPDLAERELFDSMPVIKIDIPAKTNLGISISGGKNKPDGPHVYIKEVIEGCDAYVDGRIRKGDRIIEINGEPFTNVTYEQARSILLRLKLQKDLASYRIKYTVNPGHVAPLKQLPSNVSPSLSTKAERISEPLRSLSIPSTVKEQNHVPSNSPNNSESAISQSSDEEAVMKELIRMMERSGEYETQLVNGSGLPTVNSLRPERSVGEDTTYKPSQYDKSVASERSFPDPAKYSSPGDRAAKAPADTSERKTITQYLEEDLNDSYSHTATQLTSNRPHNTRRRRRGRRLSLDPMTKIKVEKLEVALNYLGYDTTPSNIQEVRRRVKVDRTGSVAYGDFVAAARDVFDLQLDDRTRTLNASTLQFALRDIDEMSPADVETHSRKWQVHEDLKQVPTDRIAEISPRMSLKDIEALEEEESKIIASRESERFTEMQASSRRIQDDLARVARERDEAIRELQYLKRQVIERDQSTSDIEEQLDRSRQEVSNAYREVEELRTRTHLVSTALKEARQRDQDYEKTIKSLKEELENGKSSNNNIGPKQREFNELQKRLVVLGCQLRKTEVSKRTYEVAVEKLTKFAQRVQDMAENEKNSTRPNSRSGSVKKPRAPATPAMEMLSQEARDTIRAVKILLEEEPLPFGWEEVYSPDGTRFYINHVTQTTSWLHPISGVQHAGSADTRNAPPPTDQKF